MVDMWRVFRSIAHFVIELIKKTVRFAYARSKKVPYFRNEMVLGISTQKHTEASVARTHLGDICIQN